MQHAGTSEKGRTVSQFMTADPVCADASSSIQQVADLLFSEDIRHVPILHEGRLFGIVSDRDMRTYAGSFLGSQPADRAARLSKPISELCESDVISVSPEDDIVEVIDLLVYHKIGALPVVEASSQRVVGIVSYIDVLREVRNTIC